MKKQLIIWDFDGVIADTEKLCSPPSATTVLTCGSTLTTLLPLYSAIAAKTRLPTAVLLVKVKLKLFAAVASNVEICTSVMSYGSNAAGVVKGSSFTALVFVP